MSDGPDYQLRSAVDRLESNLSVINRQVDLVGHNVNSVQTLTTETRSELLQLRADFDAWRQVAERTANVQRAETKIGAVQDTIGREFGHHETVRLSATGILQAFDIGLVSEQTVKNISEQLMITNPRYWLAPALVGLAAWGRDDQSMSERGVAEAYRRSPDKTSLFFALITRRQGRYDASIRWLRHYLNTQDPARLGRDFATVLEAVAQGAFSAAARDMVQEALERWRDELLNDDAATNSQIANWLNEVRSHADGNLAANRYANLAKVSPQWPRLESALAGAHAHEPLRAKYHALLTADIQPSERLEDAVDDILDHLVKDYDLEELPLRRQLANLEAIIEHDGDMSAAVVTGQLAQAALGETLDYLTVQTSSALTPERIGVSRATQRVAVGACADWFRSAHDQHGKEYRSMLPNDVKATFGGSHTVASSTFKLPDWSSSFNRPMPELQASLAQHWDRHMNPWVELLRYNWRRALIAPSIVVGLVLIIFIAAGAAVAGLVIALLVGAIWGLVIRNRYGKSELAVARAKAVLTDAKRQSLHALAAARSELDDWQREYRTEDGNAVKVHSLIDDFRGTQGSATSAYERRTVNTEGWN
jgi:hypothetical protein